MHHLFIHELFFLWTAVAWDRTISQHVIRIFATFSCISPEFTIGMCIYTTVVNFFFYLLKIVIIGIYFVAAASTAISVGVWSLRCAHLLVGDNRDSVQVDKESEVWHQVSGYPEERHVAFESVPGWYRMGSHIVSRVFKPEQAILLGTVFKCRLHRWDSGNLTVIVGSRNSKLWW